MSADLFGTTLFLRMEREWRKARAGRQSANLALLHRGQPRRAHTLVVHIMKLRPNRGYAISDDGVDESAATHLFGRQIETSMHIIKMGLSVSLDPRCPLATSYLLWLNSFA